MIPVGTIITYVSDDWHTGGVFSSPDNTLNKVESLLRRDGFLPQPGSQTDVSFLGSVGGVVSGDIKFGVTLIVKVAGGTGYAKAEDVAAIINHEAWSVSGILPGQWRITDISLPAPGNGERPNVQCGKGFIESVKGFLGLCVKPAAQAKPKGLFDAFTSSTILYVGLAVFGFVAALALIGYSGALRKS